MKTPKNRNYVLEHINVSDEERKLLLELSDASCAYHELKANRNELIAKAMRNKVARRHISNVTGLTESYLYKVAKLS